MPSSKRLEPAVERQKVTFVLFLRFRFLILKQTKKSTPFKDFQAGIAFARRLFPQEKVILET